MGLRFLTRLPRRCLHLLVLLLNFLTMKTRFCADDVMVNMPLFHSGDGGSIPTSPLQLLFRPITNHTANLVAVESHYAHRKAPITWAFGAFFNNNLVGIITFGKPPSQHLCIGVCGRENQERVYELNRLWVSDEVPKNGESFLIANTMCLLDREIVVSFADTSQGHLGVVYQASNFIYTGLSSKFKDPKVKGKENMHHATYAHGMTNAQVIEKFGEENVVFVERPRKHRYIYFNCDKRKKKELLSKLRYKITEYPKRQSS